MFFFCNEFLKTSKCGGNVNTMFPNEGDLSDRDLLLPAKKILAPDCNPEKCLLLPPPPTESGRLMGIPKKNSATTPPPPLNLAGLRRSWKSGPPPQTKIMATPLLTITDTCYPTDEWHALNMSQIVKQYRTKQYNTITVSMRRYGIDYVVRLLRYCCTASL